MKTYITHAQLVMENDVLDDASLLIEDGKIAAICPTTASAAKEINIQQQYLMPGMIDLHCDALEKEVEPRPNVLFPFDFACAQADKRNAAAGITTVYHALSFASNELGVRNIDTAADIARAVHQWRPHGLVDNRVHCRYEITDPNALPVLKTLLNEEAIHLISMMDHTPGQGQFKDLNAYRDYLIRNYKKTADEVHTLVEHKIETAVGAFARMQELVELAHVAGIAVASHDDDSPERIDTMCSIGANISEFPITLEAARAAKEKGMYTIYGAPNIMRGKSQSGSMKAIDAIHHQLADCLCADYAPATLIVAIFKVIEATELNLPQAMQLVCKNPAAAAGLDDRGSIECGKRADLICVGTPGALPQVTRVWVHGQQVYRVRYDHD